MSLYDNINYWMSKCASLQQEVDVLNEKLANASVIKWQTGEPKENDVYFVSLVFGNSEVTTLLNYYRGVWLNFKSSEFPSEFVIAWCKLSNIEPYKGKG